MCFTGAAVSGTSETTVAELLSCIQTNWTGFKIVGDNVDKNFRPSTQRHDNKTKSMHWFHLYAVKDRIDLSSYSDCTSNLATIDVNELLIHKDDIKQITSDAEILISR